MTETYVVSDIKHWKQILKAHFATNSGHLPPAQWGTERRTRIIVTMGDK